MKENKYQLTLMIGKEKPYLEVLYTPLTNYNMKLETFKQFFYKDSFENVITLSFFTEYIEPFRSSKFCSKLYPDINLNKYENGFCIQCNINLKDIRNISYTINDSNRQSTRIKISKHCSTNQAYQLLIKGLKKQHEELITVLENYWKVSNSFTIESLSLYIHFRNYPFQVHVGGWFEHKYYKKIVLIKSN
jgi:hypothetical protein